MLANTVRVFFVFLRIWGNVRRIVHGGNVILIPQSREKNLGSFLARSYPRNCNVSLRSNMTAQLMGSQQVKQRKHKNPDEIDKVPEKSADFDTIGQVLGIALVKPLAHRQPHVDEHEHAAEHVQTM